MPPVNQGVGEQTPGIVMDFLAMTKAAVAAGGAGATITSSGVTINATGVIYLQSFLLPRNVTWGWEAKFTSVGTIDAKIEIEQGFQRPVTEGAADSTWAVPDNKLTTNGLFQEIVDANYHITSYSPDATPFARVKITGLGSNNAATLLEVMKGYAIKNTLA